MGILKAIYWTAAFVLLFVSPVFGFAMIALPVWFWVEASG